MITQKKWLALQEWMATLEIDESDITEQYIIGSGSGGQNLHKTANCVLLTHSQSNIQVKCQDSRSRETNRYMARRRLCEKIDHQKNEVRSKHQQQIAKIRKQKQKRKKRAADKQNKEHQSQLKQSRRMPKASD